MKKIAKGERVEGIEHDPLENAESDYKMDYSMIPGYLKREESSMGTDKLKIEPMADSIKFVNKILDKGRKIRESHLHDHYVKEVKEEGESKEHSRR